MKNFTQTFSNLFKSITICLIIIGLLFSGNALFAQKVIIIGANYDGNGANMDRVAFVVNTPLVNGDVIYINDYEYNNTTNVFGGGPETIIKFIANTNIAKGQVIELSFFPQQTNNTVNVLCTSGSACGTASLTLGFASATHNFRGGGESIYAYSDTDDDPTNGITEIFSVIYVGDESLTGAGGNISATENPVPDFPNCIVLDGFTGNNASPVGRVEYNTSRSASVSKAMLENTSNYSPMGSSLQALDRTAFNLNLAGANPVLTLAASPTSIVENASGTITYTFTLSANAASNITVNFSVGGTATFGTDYTQSGASSFTTTAGTITIPSGSNTASFTIDPSADATLEPNETVIITVTAGTGYDAGSPSNATVTITNDDTGTSLPKVALVGINQADQSANPSHFDGFSFVALDDLASGTVVYFTRRIYDKTTLAFGNTYTGTVKWTAGSGVNRGDVYTVMETSTDVFTVTCSDGSSCGTITNLDAGFSIPSGGITMFAYSDNNDVPTDGVTEIYSALHTGDLTVSGNGGSIPTISNPSSVYLNAVVIDNFPNAVPGRIEYKFPTERQVTVTRTLLTNVSNWLNAQSTATAPSTVPFTNIIVTSGVANPFVTVTPSPSSVLENSGTGMVYTFTLSQNAASNMTINFGVSGTATFTTDYTQTGATSFTSTAGSVVIPSGSNSASVIITPVAETTLEANETVVLTIDVGTGYDAGNPNVATGTITNDDVRNVNPAVVIVGMNHGNNSNIPTSQSPDGFSFAANQNLAAGTDIYFVDGLFNNTSLTFGSLEAVVKFTVGTGGLAKGQVVYIVETAAGTNAFTVTCSAGSNCGTATYITQSIPTDFNFASSGGDNLYAYSDTDGNPTNGITDVYSLFYSINSAIPSIENPITVFPNAVIITGFGSTSPDRTEYKFASNERSSPINLANIQNTANYLIGQATQSLSVIPFAALNLCPASITTNPSNPAAICQGTNTSFTVVASGSGLTYQWQVNSGSGFTNITEGGIYSGATSTTLTLTAVPLANNGFTYQCVVNDCVTSTAATLTVNATPTASPGSNTPVCVGSNLNLTSTVASSYLWTGPNSFSSTLQNPTVSNVSIVAGGTYTLSITNAGGCTATATTAVVINSTPAPTSPTATPSNFTVSGTTTLTATGCNSPSTITWYDTANSTVALPNNTPTISANKTFFARCTGTNTCISSPSTNVSVTYNPCTPLGSSPGNVNITWTGLVSTDWNTACNWNPTWVPDATNNEVIIPNTTNKPIVTGTVPTIKLMYIQAGATLTVNSGGTLNVNTGNAVTSITLQGGGNAIINDGTINVGTGSGIGIYVTAPSNITNRGTINANNSFGIQAILTGTFTFTNENTGIINSDFRISGASSILNLTNHGTINYSGGTYALNLNGSASVINDGTIDITAASGISNPIGSTITNNACGKILMSAGVYENGGTTINAGLIQLTNDNDFSNTGIFTNNGVLKANTVSGITNNKMVITNACPIFTLGGSNNYTVNGIFTDAGATTSAGTYTSVGNKFTANNTIPAGTQTLYAKVTDGTCTFTVPFDFNNQKPTAVSISTTNTCVGTSITLSATCSSGTVAWYGSAAGTTQLGTGTTFSYTPSAGTGQAFYAACENGTPPATTCNSGRTITSNFVNVYTIPEAPTVTLISPAVVCQPSTLNLTASGCAGTVTWSDNSTGTSLTISATGTYNVSATCSVNGCTSVSSTGNTGLVINAKPNAPTITPPISLSVCSPSTLTLTVSDCAGTVTWSQGAATGSSLTLSAVGTYAVSATCTVNGCTSDASSTITGLEIKAKPNAPTITPPTTLVVCSPSTLTLTASGCAGTVTWSQGGSTGTSLTLSAAGTYSISATCTVNGCTSVSSTSVNGLEIKAKPNAPTITPPISLSVCSPSNLTLTASGCAGTVTWSQGGSTGTSLTLSAVGTYAVSATCTVNECTSEASTTITGLEIKAKPNAPTITPPISLSVCSPSTLTLTASGCAGTVTWSQGGSTGTSLTLSAAGTYSISATCTVNGCTSDVSTSVNGLEIKAKPNAPTITPPISLSVCSPSNLTLTASGCAGTVTWSQGGSTGSSLTLSAVGTYAVSATCTVNGCTSDASSTLTGLEIKAKPNAPTITPPTTLVVCSPSTLTLTASGCAGTVTWSQGGSTGTSLTLSAAGTYSIAATCTVNGCTSDASTSVNGLEIKAKPNAPTITPPISLSVCSPSNLTLTASGCVGTVTWSQGAATGSSLTLSAVGTYAVSATCTVNGCTSEASSTLTGLEIKAKPNAPTITPPTTLVVCSPSTLTLTASGCAGTVTWSQGGSTGTSLTLSAAGTYSISATCTVNGCTSDVSTSVTGLEIKAKPNAPTITPPISLSVCSPSNLTLTASGCAGTVTWSQGGSTGTSLTLSAVGTYAVSATCTVNGCTSDASSTITGLEIKAKPNAPTITPPTTLVVCSPSTLTLTASGCAGTVTWSQGGSTGTSLTLSAVGTYSISATCTVNGCTSEASTSVTGLEIKAQPTITATNTGPYTVGQTINLNASGGGSYSWNGPNNFSSTLANPTISNALSVNGGVYTLSVVGTNGCSAIATTNVSVNGVDPCDPSRIVDYLYVKAGNPYQPLFPLTNGMLINQMTDQVSILVNPVCPSVTIESFEMNIQGPELNWNIIQNVSPYALFDNLGLDVWGRNFKPGNYTLTVTGYAQDNKGGGVTYGPKIITFTVVGNLATINAPTLSKTNICAGNSVDVSFATTGTFNGTNQFNVELSDSSGSFAAPVLIGTTSTTGTLTCTIPQSTLGSTKYLIRVTSSNQVVVSNPAMSQVTVYPLSYNLVSPNNNITGTNTKKAVNTISASNKVSSPANVTYQAGKSIMLSPGFESGAVFKAEIQGCNN